MRLYKTANGRFAGTQADAKAEGGKFYSQIEVPTDKAGLIAFLNTHMATASRLSDEEVRQSNTPEAQHEAAVRMQPVDYDSPLTARSTIAAIDAGMCSSAIRQMESTNLAKIATAVIERMAELSRRLQLGSTDDLLS